jgi:hypothetical protein
VVEDLVSAVEFLKTHSNQSIRQNGSNRDGTEDGLKGLGIEINAARGEITISGRSVRASFSSLVVWTRRRIIPYRLRAVISFILSQFRVSNLMERIIGVGIILVGSVLWASNLVDRGRTFVEEKLRKKLGGQTHLGDGRLKE